MPFRIKLSGTPYEFSADPDENIFEAAERNGYALPCACRSGACGACKAQIISGDVDLGKYQPFALTDADVHGKSAFGFRNQGQKRQSAGDGQARIHSGRGC